MIRIAYNKRDYSGPIYQCHMTELTDYTYYHPITVRFADLDAQGHVNNAIYLTYLESARLGYYEKVGIWRRESGVQTGMVVAHIDIDYLAPIFFGQAIQVGLKLGHMGHKSFTLDFIIETVQGKTPLARGTSVLVPYDSQAEKSMPIPLGWRENMLIYEQSKGES